MLSTEHLDPAPAAKNPTNAVANVLRDQIRAGYYKEGDWLPTERALAEKLGVDRRIVRSAINKLVESGLVIRRPHCRPIVGSAGVDTHEVPATDVTSPGVASNLFALLMWHGGGQYERSFTSQQRIFWGMNLALAEAGHHAVFVDVGAPVSEADCAAREAEKLNYILSHGFGGAVFYPYAYRSNREFVQEIARKIPLVTIDRRIDGAETDFVGVDNYHAMYDAITHLIHQGHELIAYITKNEPINPVQDRMQGYMAAMSDANLREMVLPIPAREQEQEWTAVDAVFRLPKGRRPTAAAAFNDYSAINLIDRLESLGLSVPGDVAITGFDDIVPALPNGVGLTSVAQPYEEIGRHAVELLLRRVANPTAPRQWIELPAPLIIRDSSLIKI